MFETHCIQHKNAVSLFILPFLFSLVHSVPHNHEEGEEETAGGMNMAGGMDMGGMELPPEHINFGNCNIRPGRNPSFSPPTKNLKSRPKTNTHS